MNHTQLWRQASHWIGALTLGAALCGQALAAELHVLSSGGFTAAYKQLVPGYEKASGDQVVSGYGASLGGAPDSIPSRLARHEPADVVILSVPALEALVAAGQVRPGSRVDLGRSLIGLSVRKGARQRHLPVDRAVQAVGRGRADQGQGPPHRERTRGQRGGAW